LFYRQSDVIALNAWTVELFDRCYADVKVRLSPATLTIGEEELNPEQVPYLEVLADEIILPREAMGLGDVKFMAGIGAFLGWPAVIFCLAVSSLLGSLVGVTLITLKKQDRSAPLPYGPYIAVAAALWLFGGRHLVGWWFAR
jgi:leader peptidase (prepilin peptidase)/N-methyltransferase